MISKPPAQAQSGVLAVAPASIVKARKRANILQVNKKTVGVDAGSNG
jgi:hypothetical protein